MYTVTETITFRIENKIEIIKYTDVCITSDDLSSLRIEYEKDNYEVENAFYFTKNFTVGSGTYYEEIYEVTKAEINEKVNESTKLTEFLKKKLGDWCWTRKNPAS